MWQYWLAKIFDGKSFSDFKKKVLQASQKAAAPTEEEIGAIVAESKKILENFKFKD